VKRKQIDELFKPFQEWMKMRKIENKFSQEAWETLAIFALWNEFIYETQQLLKGAKAKE